MSWVRSFQCMLLGHKWHEEDFKRTCRCGAYEVLMEKRYPRIGEAKYCWRRLL